MVDRWIFCALDKSLDRQSFDFRKLYNTSPDSAELIERGIRVNTVSPGAIATPFHSRTGLSQEALEANAQKFIAQIPMKRFGTPEEIAEAVLFLSTSDSSYIVGTEIAVDGGISQL